MMTAENAEQLARLVKCGIDRRRADKKRLALWEHALMLYMRENKKSSLKVCGVTLRRVPGFVNGQGPAARKRARQTERIIIDRRGI